MVLPGDVLVVDERVFLRTRRLRPERRAGSATARRLGVGDGRSRGRGSPGVGAGSRLRDRRAWRRCSAGASTAAPMIALMARRGSSGSALIAWGTVRSGRIGPRRSWSLVPLGLPGRSAPAVDPASAPLRGVSSIRAGTTAPWPTTYADRPRLAAQPRSARARASTSARPPLALVAFLVAFHLASGQSRRHLLLARDRPRRRRRRRRSGIGHRIFGVTQALRLPHLVDSLDPADRPVRQRQPHGGVPRAGGLRLPGLLVSAADGAQPDRLAGRDAALRPAARRRRSRAARSWRSRWRSLMFVLLRYIAPRRGGARSPARRAGVGCAARRAVVLGAAALGADQLVDRFKTDGGDRPTCASRLWRDSLRVLAAHPLGIGRGAFDRVFPVYRT